MKKLISIFTAGAALICALLNVAGCVTTPPPPVTLSNAELENAADTLYNKLCQSGILDKIAAENEDAEEDELPTVEYDRMITNRWKNRGNVDAYVLVKRFVEKLRDGGHMVVMDDTRGGIDSELGRKVNNVIDQNESEWTEIYSIDDLTKGRPESDYRIKGEIYDDSKRLGNWQVVRHTIAIHLTKPTEEGTRTLWSEKVHIEKSREF